MIHNVAEWQHERRRYGPHCTGLFFQSWKGVFWTLRFIQFVDNGRYHIEFETHGANTLPDLAAAQAACDAQVQEWQERFPMLEIIARDESTDPQKEETP
jgi:hypothetical protein